MRFLACLLPVAAAACRSDGPTDHTPVSLAGTWRLQTVNGNGLPVVLEQNGAYKEELTSDVLTVAASGTFTQSMQIRVTESGQVTTETVEDAGSYTLNGTAVTFTFDSDGWTGTGSVSGNTLTVAVGGLALVYRKQ